MTVQECACRDRQTIQRIETVLRSDVAMMDHAGGLDVRIDNAVVVIGGFLPNISLLDSVVPLVRRAGVLSQVRNQIRVAS